MKSRVPTTLAVTSVLVLTGLSAVPLATNADAEPETVTTLDTDFRGKPPFRRSRVEVPVVDVAAVEIPETPVETITVWRVDHSGKPPYTRRRVEVPVVDAAALEVSSDDDVDAGPVFRGRPPFRRH